MEKKFKSFDEAKRFLEDFEKENFVQLYIAHSRTIEGARKKGFSRHIKPELKYKEIYYRCIHGGIRKESRSTGIRPNQSSYRQGCPFLLKVKASTDGESLEIVELLNEHNHHLSKETSSYLPKFKALDIPIRHRELTKSSYLRQLEANKKPPVQAEPHMTKNRNVTLPKTKFILPKTSILLGSEEGEENNIMEESTKSKPDTSKHIQIGCRRKNSINPGQSLLKNKVVILDFKQPAVTNKDVTLASSVTDDLVAINSSVATDEDVTFASSHATDEDVTFATSLVPFLKRINEDKKIDVRIEILQVLRKFTKPS